MYVFLVGTHDVEGCNILNIYDSYQKAEKRFYEIRDEIAQREIDMINVKIEEMREVDDKELEKVQSMTPENVDEIDYMGSKPFIEKYEVE